MKPSSRKKVNLQKPYWRAACCNAKAMPLLDDSCKCDVYLQEWHRIEHLSKCSYRLNKNQACTCNALKEWRKAKKDAALRAAERKAER